MSKEYYFFFRCGMPLAVFYTDVPEEAMYLFSRLYKQKWVESVQLGISVKREKDVLAEDWERIHATYKEREEALEKIRDSKRRIEFHAAQKAQIKIQVARPKSMVENGSTLLESAKYLR